MNQTMTTSRGTQVEIIPTGTFLLDGGTMFGRVPKTMWELWFPADDRNRIVMAGNCLKITTPDRIVLVDTGMGIRYDDEDRDIYGLKPMPLTTGPIDTLICTHLHFDHCGGIHDLDIGNVQVARTEWEDAHLADPLTRSSYRPVDLTAIAAKLTLIDPPTPIGDHITIIPSPGHTRGHVSILIDNEIFYPGDLIPTSAHCHLPCVMAYDLYPLEVVETKRHLLNMACEHNWLIVFEHDPYCLLGRVTNIKGRFKAQPESSIPPSPLDLKGG